MIDLAWLRSDSDWMAKLSRARAHVDALHDVCDAYRSRMPFEIEPEATGDAGRTLYRLVIKEPIPPEIPLIVGDVLHNCRSALDALFHAVVENDLGRPLTEPESRSCQFPIEIDPVAFDAFFDGHGRRKMIISTRVRKAARWPQSFYWLESAKQDGLDVDLSHVQNAAGRTLPTLARLSNVDKHRRLTVTTFGPGVVVWTTREDGPDYKWEPGDGTYSDGSILLYMTGPDGHRADLEYNLVIALSDLVDPRVTRFSDSDDVTHRASAWVSASLHVMQEFLHGMSHYA